MAYVPTAWVETGMSTDDKVDGLNNLETIYSEAISYIDDITHSSNYYTDAQANAKFFTASTDGAGSGLVAATVDGMTAQEIINIGVPSGCIAIWSSTVGSIPDGWYLCDGRNSTPNLCDRFIVCSGGNYTKGDTGGSDTVTCTGTVTIAGHALTAAETPLHTHTGITDYWTDGSDYATNWGNGLSNSASTTTRYTATTGSGTSHTHTASFAGTSNQDKRPPFYALCYIMKA